MIADRLRDGRTNGLSAKGMPLDRLRVVAILLVCALTIFNASGFRGLYADGAWYLLSMLTKGTFYHVSYARWSVELLTQFPVVWSLKLGVTDLRTLIHVYSASLVIAPALFWTLALVRLIRDEEFWLIFILLCLVLFNVGFMAVGEFNVAYSLVALSMAILITKRDLSLGWMLAAVMAALCLVVAYEMTLFLGPLLIVMAIGRLWTDKLSVTTKCLLWFCVACYAAGTGVAGYSVLHFRVPENLSHAADVFGAARNRSLLLSVAFAVGYVLLRLRVYPVRHLGYFVMFASLVLLAWPSSYSVPDHHYVARTLVGVCILVCGLILAASWIWERWRSRPIVIDAREAQWLAIALFLVMSVGDVINTRGLTHFVTTFRSEVDVRAGLVPLEDTKLSGSDHARYAWTWTYPTLSLLLRHDPGRAVILNDQGYHGYQPFDPKVSVPSLQAYYGAR
jgi:hypothetical protein